MVADITSRSLRISWKKPRNSYGEILGYVVQLRNDSGDCVRETIIECTNCTGNLVSGSWLWFPSVQLTYFLFSFPICL